MYQGGSKRKNGSTGAGSGTGSGKFLKKQKLSGSHNPFDNKKNAHSQALVESKATSLLSKEEEEEETSTTTTTTSTTNGVNNEQEEQSSDFFKVSLPKPSKERQPTADTVDGTVFEGTKTWSDLGLAANIIRSLQERLKFPKPTKIQTASIPVLLQKKDTLVKAHTGSGKTLSYGLAILQELQSIEPRITRAEGTYAIILVPTRELALQTYEVLKQAGSATIWLVPGLLSGGEKKKSEKERLRKGITILVATPGRLLDHLNTTSCFNVQNLRWLILDEADRLMDMGFEEPVTQIVKILKSHVQQRAKPLQTALISATLTDKIKKLAGFSLQDPVYIDVDESSAPKSNEGESTSDSTSLDGFHIPKMLHQNYVSVPCKQRLVTLAAFLRWKAYSIDNCKIIVFLSNCDSVDFHYTLFGKSQIEKRTGEEETEPFLPIKVFRLHGNLTQLERTKIFFDFKKASGAVLFCTDVVARGMDFPVVHWIIQYDPPGEPKEYIHRVGRTARVGREGNALLFLLPSEEEYIQFLNLPEVKHLTVDTILETLQSQKRKSDPSGLVQVSFETMVQNDKTLLDLAHAAYKSSLRAYATHSKETKHIFHVRNIHFGHFAKSFGLREPPSQFLAADHHKMKEIKYKTKEKKKSNTMKTKMNQATNVNSEFDTGF